MQRRERALSILCDILFYTLGSCLYAVGMNCFAVPNRLVIGGFSGIGTMLNYLTGFPIGAFIFIANIPLFYLGYRFIGKDFIVRTFAVTLFVSALIDISKLFLPVFRGDAILVTLAGGVSLGTGLALIFLRGATTGGADIIAKLISRRYRHIPMGRVMVIFDVVVILFSALIYRNFESVLYSIVLIFISGRMVDFLNYGSVSGKLMFVITDKWDDIYNRISSATGRGCTVIPVQGAYTMKARKMMFIAVRNNEISKVYRIISAVDKNAFITLAEAREILGEGFRRTDE